jgi:hypothetical protein
MYGIPIGASPILDPPTFGATFTSDVTFGFAAWLAVAAVGYLVVLPLALRRREVMHLVTAPDMERARRRCIASIA